MDKCCLCKKNIENEEAPVLSMTAAGRPRYLCDECAALLDTVTLGKECEQIEEAMDQVSRIMAKNEPDGVTYSIISKIMVDAAVRGKLIKKGVYDFARDELPYEDELEDIPEDLLESEDDAKKDEIEAKKNERFNKVYNIILYTLLGLTAGVVIWRLVQEYLLKKMGG